MPSWGIAPAAHLPLVTPRLPLGSWWGQRLPTQRPAGALLRPPSNPRFLPHPQQSGPSAGLHPGCRAWWAGPLEIASSAHGQEQSLDKLESCRRPWWQGCHVAPCVPVPVLPGLPSNRFQEPLLCLSRSGHNLWVFWAGKGHFRRGTEGRNGHPARARGTSFRLPCLRSGGPLSEVVLPPCAHSAGAVPGEAGATDRRPPRLARLTVYPREPRERQGCPQPRRAPGPPALG